jgi:hypothetical protein
METPRPVYPETLARGKLPDFRAKPNMERPRHTFVVRFGTYAVSPQSGEVRKAGVKIRVQQQPLSWLVRRRAVMAFRTRRRIRDPLIAIRFDARLSSSWQSDRISIYALPRNHENK